jgi:hypothetical protein
MVPASAAENDDVAVGPDGWLDASVKAFQA